MLTQGGGKNLCGTCVIPLGTFWYPLGALYLCKYIGSNPQYQKGMSDKNSGLQEGWLGSHYEVSHQALPRCELRVRGS